jgi:hypothetical protein
VPFELSLEQTADMNARSKQKHAEPGSSQWHREANGRYLAFGLIVLTVTAVLTIGVAELLGTGVIFWIVVAVIVAAAWFTHDRYVHGRWRA